ncbi:hypothetical protein HAX54_025624 [Datura stramonium]|uniref:Transmembrane protein n=1 Tax=Datura stramonium TaxID=4076 RepID=A0ABS8UZS7_DATST|nr:hypothetical protein [Datura stramonium]
MIDEAVVIKIKVLAAHELAAWLKYLHFVGRNMPHCILLLSSAAWSLDFIIVDLCFEWLFEWDFRSPGIASGKQLIDVVLFVSFGCCLANSVLFVSLVLSFGTTADIAFSWLFTLLVLWSGGELLTPLLLVL